MRKLICVDFDGVIHSYITPWKEAWIIPDPPVEGAMKWLWQMVNTKDYKIVIYSGRSKVPSGISAMRGWIAEYASLELDGIETASNLLHMLDFASRKPAAFLTIDDRAICFRGTFPSTREIDNFKPWYNKYAEVAK